jgi:hypothetical protein
MIKEIAHVMRIAKEARHKEASGYVLNQSLQLECRLLEAEIEALKKIEMEEDSGTRR